MSMDTAPARKKDWAGARHARHAGSVGSPLARSSSGGLEVIMRLYGFAGTRTMRALWALRELDLDFEYVEVDLTAGAHRRPDFLALNPAGKVPVLVDGDLVR